MKKSTRQWPLKRFVPPLSNERVAYGNQVSKHFKRTRRTGHMLCCPMMRFQLREDLGLDFYAHRNRQHIQMTKSADDQALLGFSVRPRSIICLTASLLKKGWLILRFATSINSSGLHWLELLLILLGSQKGVTCLFAPSPPPRGVFVSRCLVMSCKVHTCLVDSTGAAYALCTFQNIPSVPSMYIPRQSSGLIPSTNLPSHQRQLPLPQNLNQDMSSEVAWRHNNGIRENAGRASSGALCILCTGKKPQLSTPPNGSANGMTCCSRKELASAHRNCKT